jgi:hypothetical protein
MRLDAVVQCVLSERVVPNVAAEESKVSRDHPHTVATYLK